jgi:hypothetical protein
MSAVFQHRGITFAIKELAPGAWAWQVQPPDSVNGFRRSNGRLIGIRGQAIIAAKRNIDAQYAVALEENSN